MAKYRVISGAHRHNGETYVAGETFEVSADDFDHLDEEPDLTERFGFKLEEANGGDSGNSEAGASSEDTGSAEPESADEAEAQDENEFDADEFVDRTPQSDIVEDLESGEYDDRLDEIESSEIDGRDRNGVKDAIADRREG